MQPVTHMTLAATAESLFFRKTASREGVDCVADWFSTNSLTEFWKSQSVRGTGKQISDDHTGREYDQYRQKNAPVRFRRKKDLFTSTTSLF